MFKGGPEPLEKEIHEILCSKREDRFSNPFVEVVSKTCQVVFRSCFDTVIYVKACGHCERSEDSRVLRACHLCTQPPVASKPGSSPPERPSLDNFPNQPWSDATCPCYTASSTLSCLLQQKERDKAEVSTSRGGTGARCVRQ